MEGGGQLGLRKAKHRKGPVALLTLCKSKGSTIRRREGFCGGRLPHTRERFWRNPENCAGSPEAASSVVVKKQSGGEGKVRERCKGVRSGTGPSLNLISRRSECGKKGLVV